jgi:hypothetical protein
MMVLLILLLPAAAFSLDVQVGVKAGMGIPFYVGTDYDDYIGGLDSQLLIAYEGGVFLTVGMEMIAIEVDLFFTSAGGAFGNNDWVQNNIDNFIEIPILVKLRFKVDEMIASLYLGPDILMKLGYFVWQQIDVDDGSIMAEDRWDEDWLNPFQFGLVIGFGLDVPFEGYYLTFDARYCLGLTSRHTDEWPEGEQWFQDNIQLLVGFGMDLAY